MTINDIELGILLAPTLLLCIIAVAAQVFGLWANGRSPNPKTQTKKGDEPVADVATRVLEKLMEKFT